MTKTFRARQGRGPDQATGAEPITRVHMTIDFAKLRDIAYLGVRRAAAFLSIGLSRTENYIPASLALSEHSNWRFFPEPLPEAAGHDAVKEFRSWLIDNALRELDLRFSLFLDATTSLRKWSELHEVRVRSDHKINENLNQTNAAKKFTRLMKELWIPTPDASMLWSLSNARNCLSHAAGIVTLRHANSDGYLSIRWLGLEPRIAQGDKYTVVPPVFDSLQAPDPSQEADLIIVVVEREKQFGLGTKVELSAYDLHEICFYYQQLTEQVLQQFAAYLRARGIGPTGIPASEADNRISGA